MRALHTVVAVVGIALAAGAAWWYQHRAPSGAGNAVPAPQVGAPAGRADAAAGGPVAVEVGRAEAVTIDDAFSTVGTLRAKQAVMLRPEVSGRVVTLGFVDGQRVRRGQLLVQLDDRLPAAQLQQAQAQASIARANLQRNRELAAQNFVSQSAVDQSQATLEVADAQVALARAQLERMRIVAPFDGVAGIRMVNLGDYVKDGADLVAIEDTSALWVDYRLPERYVTRVRVGQTVEVALDAAPERRLSARIEALDAQVDADGRSLLVRARMDNAGGTMKSGMFARTRTVFASRSRAIVVPEEALVPLGERQLLFKVVDGPGGKVSQRIDAKVGMRLPGKVEVLEGLREGDLVVVAGQARLLRGEALPLRVVEVGAAASAPAPAASGGVAPRRVGAAV
ncbi:efflux RND transporter periplasmic adaptor subunit [Azohydromonas sp.]|uniref:efflux RND transporter periplasmic adaptor subunit n=1 Tax=Azohydromonas sp. TaxID=1872666 RepID=UPI002C347973|nr:efflux RND transporter periplasmic adaptor subunit [Azohydromonas sp.]HMM85361.1 efflux RND transporter periplasmic adaptor subunit [Azohydromonas sp.]